MANVLVEEQYLQDIANAIRGKNGLTDTYTPAQMSTAISNISGSGGSFEQPILNNNILFVPYGHAALSVDCLTNKWQPDKVLLIK